MPSMPTRRRWVAALAVLTAATVTACGSGVTNIDRPGIDEPVRVDTAAAELGGKLVIYNGRAHYGTEQVFLDFEKQTGVNVVLRGGSASELFKRLQQEGADTPADVLVTTDLTRLYRAKQAGLLLGVTSKALREHIPAELHAPDGEWWAITTRVRTPVRSLDDVPPGSVTSYADLGDPRFQGRLCLRTSNSEYNQSLVADLIAKRGYEATKKLLESWMANDPEIVGSDGELLALLAADECDVGLVNHYYLARALKESGGTFPVAPAWPGQPEATSPPPPWAGNGAHTNVSGIGVVRWSDNVPAAVKLMEYLTAPQAQRKITRRGEFPANPQVPPADFISEWADVKTNPIAVEEAGKLLDEATALMLEVGWE